MKFILSFFLVVSLFGAAQTDTITLVAYNVLNFPDGRNDCSSNTLVPNRSDTLRKILGYLKPDIFVACEIQNAAGADSILTRSLNAFGASNYAMAQFSASSTLNNSMYYNTNKLTLQYHNVISTSPRDIDHYVLYLKDPNLGVHFDTTFIEVYMCHLKAGTGVTNAALRAEQTAILMDYIASRPLDRNHFVCGDLNVYTSNETGYQNLLSGPFGLIDPINAPGSWNNNASYAAAHTQSTRNNQSLDCGSLGGLDDRFDQILVSNNVMQGTDSLMYLVDSYDAVGNDGNHFNSNLLAAPVNTQYPDSVVRALYYMSDHLPVALKAVVNFPTSNGLTLYPIVQGVSCYGENTGQATIVANGGESPYTYLWDTNAGNQTTATAVNLTSGIYCVQVTDNLGDVDAYCLYVPQSDSLSYSVFLQPDTGDCSGSVSIILGGATEPFTIQWNDGLNQTGQTASNLCSGLYNATITDGNGCEYTIEVEIVKGTTSLELFDLNGISIYPNPANEFITLSGLQLIQSIEFECFSVLGVKMDLQKTSMNEDNLVFDISRFARGVYFIKIHSNGQAVTRRFIRE